MDDGSMYVSEHGPSTDDEFNKLVKGGNYGWPLHRGVTDTEAEKQMVDTTAIQEALFYWTPTIAPSSLLYYDNDLLPSLKGHFLVSTLKETDIRLLKIEGDSTVETHTILEGEFGRIRDMAVDENGVLYLSTANILPLTRYAYETLDKDTSLYYDVIVKVYAEK
jgi:glucose/arabinose dehydrogenase